MVIVTACAQPAILPQLPVARGEEDPVGDANAEALFAQGAGRNRGRYHDGTADVGTEGNLLVLREMARAAGSVVHGLVKNGMTAAAMALSTCDPLPAVRSTRVAGGHLSMAGVAGGLGDRKS